MANLTESQKLLKELKILNIQQATYEKDCKILHDNFQSKTPEFSGNIFELNRKMVNHREKQKSSLIAKTNEIQQNIQKAKFSIQNFDDDGNIESLRKLMESISICTEKLKSSQAVSYENLMNEFSVYENELRAMEKRLVYDTRIKKISNNTNSVSNKRFNYQTDSKNTTSNQLPEEVVEYQNFLVLNGGLTGGWDDFDHSCFVKLYKKFVTNPDKFLEESLISLPNKTIEAIKLHRIWYERFQELLDLNKQAIIRWKRGKQINIKSKNNSDTVKSDQDLENLAKIKIREKNRRLKEKEKVLAWREQKNLEDEMKEREKKDLQLEIQRRKEEKFKHDLKIKKVEVDIYKAEKLKQQADKLEAEVKLIEEARKRRKEEVKENFYHFQSRDVSFVRGRLEKKKLEEIEKEEKQRRLERVKNKVARPKVERDFDRLTRPTTASRRREEADKESAGCTVGARVLPSRAVPTWRKNM